ncbi:MAG: IgGFc-binding protein [Myxococcales bacterium]|nr:IgGFc-binding protein [Myxococcales bacterium]
MRSSAPAPARLASVTPRRLSLVALLLGPALACGDSGAGTATESATTTLTSTTEGATAGTTEDGTTAGTTGGPGTTAGTTGAPTTTEGATTSATTGAETSDASATSGTTGEPVCPEGTVVCEGGVSKVCDGEGGFMSEEPCDQECADGLGCVLCLPGTGSCDGEISSLCNDQGDGYDEYHCDGVQGVTCDPDSGACVGACAPQNLVDSYIGCDYYPTVTPNVVGNNYTFAVVISNTSNGDAMITITKGDAPVLDTVVAASSVEVIPLAWENQLKGAGASRVVPDGAYRVRSDRPITAYQYNPLEYTLNGGFTYTNDASLLMPVNAWTADYWVAARNHHSVPGFYAVVASEDGTTVDVDPSATGGLIGAGGGIAGDGTGQAALDQGDVLLVMSVAGGGSPDVSDVTGTHVLADKPVQVIGGHMCTFVPYNISACDHLEESMFAYENLSAEYIVTTPLVKALGQPPVSKARIVRVVATKDATELTYDPPVPGAPSSIASAGDYVELTPTEADFMISANAKIIVAEYLQGQSAGGNAGDPAMTIAVPIEQYRNSYLFHAPTNYESSFVNITAPDGAAITLDGAPVGGLSPIGATGFSVARVELSNAGDGTHSITGDQPFGIQVYGYGQYTSYWYPGGLDLAVILE